MELLLTYNRVAQLRTCLEDWSPDSISSPPNCHSDTPPPADDDGKDVSSTKVSPSKTNISYVQDDPDIMNMYNNRPLPPLPSTSTSFETNIKPTNPEDSSSNDKLNLTCHHGPSSSQTHEIQTPLETLHSNGPSQLDLYTKDQQNHEMLAVGIPSPVMRWRRSGESRSGVMRSGDRSRSGVRIKRLQVKRKRKSEGQDDDDDEGKK
jgi:hypothetical protein